MPRLLRATLPLGLDTSEISTTLDTQTYEKEGLLNLFQTFQGRKPTSHSNSDPWSILCCLGLAQAFVIMIGHQYRACSSVLVDLLPDGPEPKKTGDRVGITYDSSIVGHL